MYRVIIGPALLGLGLEAKEHGTCNAVLHFLDIFYSGSERRRLVFPCLLCHNQQAPGPTPKEQHEQGEASGCLWIFPDSKEQIGKEASVPAVLLDNMSEHPLHFLFKSFHQPVNLWLVH